MDMRCCGSDLKVWMSEVYLNGHELGTPQPSSPDQQKCRVIHMNQAVSHELTHF